MRLARYLLALSLSCFTLIAHADELIIEPDNGRAPILNAINETKHSLSLVMYGLTDQQLLAALLKQKELGRTVKVILEKSPYKADDENLKTISAFDQDHLNWQGTIPPFRLIHQKTLIIDGRKALIFTGNFTHSTFKNERNFGLILDDPKKVNEIAAAFNADWNHQPIGEHDADIIYSPDDSRQKLLALFNNAKRSIKIYSQQVNDYKVVGALAKAARRGISVDILTSATFKQKQLDYLTRAGVNIHTSKDLYIHAKTFIIDDNTAVIGSINLTRPSLDDNRELAVITHDPHIVSQLVELFQKDNHATVGLTHPLLKLLNNKQMARQLRHWQHHLLAHPRRRHKRFEVQS